MANEKAVGPPSAIFERRWKDYPRKEKRDRAEAAFRKSITSRADLAAFDQALENYLAHVPSLELASLVMQGGTFFGGRWRDWVAGNPLQEAAGASKRRGGRGEYRPEVFRDVAAPPEREQTIDEARREIYVTQHLAVAEIRKQCSRILEPTAREAHFEAEVFRLLRRRVSGSPMDVAAKWLLMERDFGAKEATA